MESSDAGQSKISPEGIVAGHVVTDALESMNRMLEAVISTSPDQICVMDRAGRFLFVGVAGAAALGMERSHIIGKTSHELGLPTEEAPRFRSERASVFESGQPFKGFTEYFTVAGVRRYEYTMSPMVGPDNHIDAVIVRARDVTELDAQRKQLIHGEERLRLAIDGGELGTWHWDLPTDVVTWSERARRIYGVPLDATINLQLIQDCVHPEDWKRVHAASMRALHEGIDIHEEYRVGLSMEDERWVLTRGRAFYDGAGKPLSIEGVVLDITERKQAEQELQIRSSVLDNMAEGVVMTDLTANIRFTNRAFDQMFGYAAGELQGMPSSILNDADPEEYPQFLAQMLRQLEEDGLWTNEFRNRRKDGAPFLTRARISRLEVGGEIFLISVQQDITEDRRNARLMEAANEWLRKANRQLEEQVAINLQFSQELNIRKAELEKSNQMLETLNAHLASLAMTDGLTGLKNHRAFQEQLTTLFEQSLRYDRSLSILLIDVDWFKPFNDAFGHPAGDEVLKKVAAVLQTAARNADFVARYGGEEFVLILPETDVEGAMRVAERVRAVLAETHWVLREITVSCGVATVTEQCNTPRKLLEAADKALYAAKAAGRNRVTHFDADTMLLRDPAADYVE